ncbi:MAG: high-potential iron-sulfur protein [Polaromonas sp.]
MTTRRQLIQSIPALPLITTAGAAALLAACGDKKPAELAAPAPATAPAPAPEPVAAAPAPAPATATATGPLVDEKDAQAAALGYVAVAAKADKAKFSNYSDGQACSNCSLYQGGVADQGGCPLYPGKQVLAKAWCSAYNKKAA